MAPTGWIDRGQRFGNSGAATQPDAVAMRSALEVDPSLFQTSMSWAGGSDAVTITPAWAGEITAVQEIAQGWEARIANNNVVQLLDLQETKFGDHLGDFLGNGPKILQWFPKAQVVDRGDGWWIAEEYILGGAWDQFNWCRQDPANFLPDTVCPDFNKYALLPVHKTKKHSGPGADFRLGFRERLPAPLGIAWGGFKTGYKGNFKGRWEVEGDRIRKVFRIADIAPFAPASQFISVDLTLGYTTTPSLSAAILSDDTGRFNGGYDGPGAVTLDSVVYWGDTDSTSLEVAGAVYDENGTPVPVNVEGATGNVTLGTITGKTLITIAAAGTPAMTLSPGTNHAMGVIVNVPGAIVMYYDNVTPSQAYRLGSPYNWGTEVWATSPTVQTNYTNQFQWGTYINYTAAGGGGIIPQIMHNRQLQRRR